MDLKKKAEESEGEKRNGKRNTLSRNIFSLSEYIFCATKACSCCLSQKSTFSHRAAFLPVGLVAKVVRVSENDENRLKVETASIGNKSRLFAKSSTSNVATATGLEKV